MQKSVEKTQNPFKGSSDGLRKSDCSQKSDNLYCKNASKLNFFDEEVVIRESNCGHFRPSGLAWGGI